MNYYILDGHNVVVADLHTFGEWYEKVGEGRVVRQEKVGDSFVSTVFLGIDHSFGGGPPQLFETMVFDGVLDQELDRYATWDEAVKGHEAMVERVKTTPDRKEKGHADDL